MAAGLAQVLDFLEGLRFSGEELEWLAQSGRFGKGLVDHLANLRFTGDVHAMPEGTVFFGNEPILRVTAPLPQAQLVETRIINILHFHCFFFRRLTLSSRAAFEDRELRSGHEVAPQTQGPRHHRLKRQW
jgi:nicotinic acid phosphoribosyltransferase